MKYLLILVLILLSSCIVVEYSTDDKEDYQDNIEAKESESHHELLESEFNELDKDTLIFDPHRNLIFEK